jgi:antitoxin component YwqK of YwqJK toxin-antitoxin module
VSYKEYIDERGFLHKQWVNNSGVCHRDDGPADIGYYPDGSMCYEEFYINGVMHREGGPAEIIYYSNGLLKAETFVVKGKYHREDGPADISYLEDGSISFEAYYFKNKFLGTGYIGFWNFWKNIDGKQKQNINVLKYLLRHS